MSYPIEGADYWIRYMVLPPGIFAFVHENDDGTYIIILDPRRDFLSQLDDWEHEILHIINDDFHNGLPIVRIENLQKV